MRGWRPSAPTSAAAAGVHRAGGGGGRAAAALLLFQLHAVPPDQARDASAIFIGLRNYCEHPHQLGFLGRLRPHRVLLTVALNLEMLLGLGLALLVEKTTRGQRVLRTIMMFPMMFSPILVGFQFKFMFNDNIGLVNNALQALGITDSAIPWLVDGDLAFSPSSSPKSGRRPRCSRSCILAGLLAMPQASRSRRRASTAARRWQTFRYVTLAVPHALRLHRHDHPLARRGARL